MSNPTYTNLFIDSKGFVYDFFSNSLIGIYIVEFQLVKYHR